jgi:hypothetical protein
MLVDTIKVSVEDLSNGYFQWLDQHPEAIPAGQKLTVLLPTIDLYSPAGDSIYFGADSASNAAFLGTLPQGIRDAKTTVVRPSLREALEMFPDWDHCKEQNEAVAKLRARAAQTSIRILEVRLHK